MQYTSVDELAAFQWHDAHVVALDLSSGVLTTVVEDLNVTRINSQNNYPNDMRVGCARARWRLPRVEEILTSGYSQYKDDGTLLRRMTGARRAASEYDSVLRSLVEESEAGGLYIMGCGPLEAIAGRQRAWIDFGGVEITFSYERFIAEWDHFAGSAWYLERLKRA